MSLVAVHQGKGGRGGRGQWLFLWSLNQRLFILWLTGSREGDLLPSIRPHLLKCPQPPQLGKKLSKQEQVGDTLVQTKQCSFLPGDPGLQPLTLTPALSPLGKQQLSKEHQQSTSKPLGLHQFYLVPSSGHPHFTALRPSVLISHIVPCTRYSLYTEVRNVYFSLQKNHMILLKFNFKTWNMTELNVST